MPNMSQVKTPMPMQEASVRRHNFEEVALGYTEDDAKNEAARCLGCKNPTCVEGCPVQIHIPEFIHHVVNGEFELAYEVLEQSSTLSSICGRVCPQETQCEGHCVRSKKGESVAIGRLERFVADWHRTHTTKELVRIPSNHHRVAVVGSGPAGLSCAGDLAKKGYEVTIFEALHTPGGVLVYGIPEFRLPKALVAQEVAKLESMGVQIETNMVIGRVFSIDDLFAKGFEAVFIGSGAGLPRFMNIPGENLKGVYSANEYLTRSNLMKAYLPTSKTPIMHAKRVAVCGGGNVAMDAARTALRLGAEHVTIVYRRSLDELPARKEEVEHAMEEGVEFALLTNPCEILGYYNPQDRRDPMNGFVTGMKCIKMELGEPDASGRRSPVEIPGSEFTMDVDAVIMAIGTSPNPLIRTTTPDLNFNKRGGIVVEEATCATSKEGVYAGGDAVTGAATVILAMGAGKNAAKAIDEYLNK